MQEELLLNEATQFILQQQTNYPDASAIVTALLEAEKTAKKDKQKYNFSQLIGTWRLCFITGTKKARKRAGIVLGAGRYLPKFITIQLSYSASKTYLDQGKVENLVQLGNLQLILTGPVKFLSAKNILAFDFTRLIIKAFGLKLYEGYIRGGQDSEVNFYQQNVGKQAFFAYFLIEENLIAARGKGGGLALWGKVNHLNH